MVIAQELFHFANKFESVFGKFLRIDEGWFAATVTVIFPKHVAVAVFIGFDVGVDGAIVLTDQRAVIDGRQADDKIIAVLEHDLAYGRIVEVNDVPQGLVDRLQHYFLSYKQLPADEPKKVEITHVYDRTEALDVINRSLRDYESEFADE